MNPYIKNRGMWHKHYFCTMLYNSKTLDVTVDNDNLALNTTVAEMLQNLH